MIIFFKDVYLCLLKNLFLLDKLCIVYVLQPLYYSYYSPQLMKVCWMNNCFIVLLFYGTSTNSCHLVGWIKLTLSMQDTWNRDNSLYGTRVYTIQIVRGGTFLLFYWFEIRLFSLLQLNLVFESLRWIFVWPSIINNRLLLRSLAIQVVVDIRNRWKFRPDWLF